MTQWPTAWAVRRFDAIIEAAIKLVNPASKQFAFLQKSFPLRIPMLMIYSAS
jgi:hypothetical protein